MLIAKRTAYLRSDGDYEIRYRRGKSSDWQWFICGELLWEFFPLSGPAPTAIRIELHDTPTKDRVAVVDGHYGTHVYCDGVRRSLFDDAYDWLQPHSKKYGTVYAEVWY